MSLFLVSKRVGTVEALFTSAELLIERKTITFEHVVDCRTGMVLRHIEVPLSQHQGSGTEKYLKQ